MGFDKTSPDGRVACGCLDQVRSPIVGAIEVKDKDEVGCCHDLPYKVSTDESHRM
jgi:hypothetical protein